MHIKYKDNKTLYNIILIFLYIISVNGFSQHPYYYDLNEDNGLPSTETYQILQDPKGYMWLGCDAGLYRFNGFEFKAYKNSKQNSRSISNLAFDCNHQLWCRNFSGQLFKVTEDSLLLVADYSSEANRFQIAFYNQPGYWKINKKEISLNDNYGKPIKHFPIDLNGKDISSGIDMIYFKDILWIEIPGLGLYYLDAIKKTIQQILPVPQSKSYQNQRFFIYQNKLFLLRSETVPSADNFIYEINTESKTTKDIYHFLNPNQIRNYFFYEDNAHKLWVGSSFGAICIPDIYQFTQPEQICFKGQKISSIHQDKEGNYWFTDLQYGLHVIPKMNSIIINEKNSTIKENDYTAIKTISNNKIIIGTYSGNLYLYNTKVNLFEELESINSKKGFTVKDIEQSNNNIYIAKGGFYVYNLTTKKTAEVKGIGNARDFTILNDTIVSIHPEFVAKTSSDAISTEKDKKEIILNIGGRKVEKDPISNDVYLALNNGLYVYKNGKIEALKLNGETVSAFTFAQDKNSIWAGTHSQGLIQIQKGKIIKQLLNKNELEDNSIKTIFINDKNIWGATNSNIFKIDLSNWKIELISNNIGIMPREINSITQLNENIYIASKKSIIKLPAYQTTDLTYIPELNIEKVFYENTLLPIDHKFTLPPDFTNLKINFISFSYRSKKEFKYHYRLIGLDSIWHSAPLDQPSVNYSSLPPGEYTFEIKSITENGIESPVKILSFNVESPLWQKGWFYFLATIFSILIIFLIFQYQIKKIRKRNELEKKLVHSQLTALKAQMNPHFMYNALNSIQALILKQDIKNSNLYLGKFSHLMRKILDISEKEDITLHEEKTILELYLSLEKLRFGNEFNYSITIDNHIDEFSACIPPMILQPFVENAIKHGLLHKKGEKLLSINFSMQQELKCTITDNGIGRKHAKEIKDRLAEKHKSFASSATEKRVELLNNLEENYKIEIIDLEDIGGEGTRVIVGIPLKE